MLAHEGRQLFLVGSFTHLLLSVKPEHYLFHAKTLDSSALPIANGEMGHSFLDLCIKGAQADTKV
ncbi:hypothetical protein CXU15_10315 [Akkermansia muciniphila]|uniref:Uncharacterized protein n=1 Tax=Akkermansia massiliensis TaxID=2927224 RepID=A0AAE6W2A2_9BACT|nr:hypothetical protein CXU15_10315 [Akkermansia muciniphila]PNC50788.1 hypothetical protein CXU11_01875 [Akkermansia muciniphila]QHV63509.1 hypothetical protein DMI76_09110 [Akkermansia massiliensis]QHV75878.1 hypothetical protein DMI75_09115 [Akkermansia massiliensis]